LLKILAIGVSLAIFCLGCGSESTSKGVVPEKPKPTAKTPGAAKQAIALPLITDKEGGRKLDLEKLRKAQEESTSQRIEVIPGKTQEELNALTGEPSKVNPKDIMVFPGMTQEQWNAKQAAVPKQVDPKNIMMYPGMTQEQWNAKQAAVPKQVDPKNIMMYPGMTQEEWNAKQAQLEEQPGRKVNELPPTSAK